MSGAWTTPDGVPVSAETINADLRILFDSLSAKVVQPTTMLIPRRNHVRMRRSPQWRNSMRRYPFKRLCLTSPIV